MTMKVLNHLNYCKRILIKFSLTIDLAYPKQRLMAEWVLQVHYLEFLCIKLSKAINNISRA